ncbi:hypothetical protein [Cesiribacter andamanensis]|uniref:Uncharacterized protein n=1 Tax=Cesiribacter andamanensis AMV16 TaxID=1279009 RepID=M7NIC2_9BACT|nr:hypothetical protein [Cesiribacter andamanensis]EMR01550.1 hypothetical protein ADICEAN_03335 [Cesiribacter andamanensis AMV16]
MRERRIFLLLLGLLLLVCASASATHIVGGEFEVQHLQNYSYRLRLVLYNDDIYGSPAAIDGQAVVHIRRKRDHAFISYLHPAVYHPLGRTLYQSRVCDPQT